MAGTAILRISSEEHINTCRTCPSRPQLASKTNFERKKKIIVPPLPAVLIYNLIVFKHTHTKKEKNNKRKVVDPMSVSDSAPIRLL